MTPEEAKERFPVGSRVTLHDTNHLSGGYRIGDRGTVMDCRNAVLDVDMDDRGRDWLYAARFVPPTKEVSPVESDNGVLIVKMPFHVPIEAIHAAVAQMAASWCARGLCEHEPQEPATPDTRRPVKFAQLREILNLADRVTMLSVGSAPLSQALTPDTKLDDGIRVFDAEEDRWYFVSYKHMLEGTISKDGKTLIVTDDDGITQLLRFITSRTIDLRTVTPIARR
jgi:hypothetical protein